VYRLVSIRKLNIGGIADTPNNTPSREIGQILFVYPIQTTTWNGKQGGANVGEDQSLFRCDGGCRNKFTAGRLIGNPNADCLQISPRSCSRRPPARPP
jgi:hypothetical protein